MIAQSDIKLHNALERLNLVLIIYIIVTLGRFGLSCLGPF
jgi:hypothetical protein